MRFLNIFGLLIGACHIIFSSSLAWSNGLAISNAWLEGVKSGDSAAAYLEIENASFESDYLQQAVCPDFHHTMLHQTTNENHGTQVVHRMHAIDSVEIPAGKRVVFQPGGIHLMLMKASKDIRLQKTTSCLLLFKVHGERKIIIEVR
jgi:copper(I)-binding protein